MWGFTMIRVFAATSLFLATSVPVWAGITMTSTPGPEAGEGMIAMGLLGATLAWLRKRRAR